MIFKATLHDRSTNTSQPLQVETQPGLLILRPELGSAEEWVLSDLQSARKLSDGTLILQNGRKFLEVPGPGFELALERSFPAHRLLRSGFFDRLGVMGCLVALLLVLLPLLAAYGWLTPWLANRVAEHISPEVEAQLGESLYQSAVADYVIDTAASKTAQQFYDALGYGGPYKIKITVVKAPIINAFALPGGHIVVFDSIIGLTNAPEQLAALLAHEASHIHLKHSLRSVLRELGSSILLGVVLGGDAGGLTGALAQHTDALADLSYSRALETEADRNGLELMRRQGVPRRGMPDLFRNMKKATGEGEANGMAKFLLTHPGLEERIQATEASFNRAAETDNNMPKQTVILWENLF